MITENTTIREMLQIIGTDLFRDKFHPNTWVNALFSDYKNKYTMIEGQHHMLIEQGLKTKQECMPNWIITDVRFPNEVQSILDRKGILIRINRNKNTFTKSFYGRDFSEQEILERERNADELYSEVLKEKGTIDTKHRSETALDEYNKWDYIINNNGSIEELVEKVKEILIKEKLI